MSLLTVAWSMCSAACLMLGLMHLTLWFHDQHSRAYLLSSIMALSGAALALIELLLAGTLEPARYEVLLRWQNLSVFLILVPLVWLLRLQLPINDRLIPIAVTTLWAAALVVNFLLPSSVTFSEVTEIRRLRAFWGEDFSVPVGIIGPWKWLADLSTALIMLIAVRGWQAARRVAEGHRGTLLAGCTIAFLLMGGVQAILVDSGRLDMPYVISFTFLAIIAAFSYDLITAAMRAALYARKLEIQQLRWRTLLDRVQLAILRVDGEGAIAFANPFLVALCGFEAPVLVGSSVEQLLPDWRTSGRASTRPQKLLCRSGESRQLLISAVELISADGRNEGVVLIGDDITERLRAESILRETEREMERLTRAGMLGELSTSLAHELNQPLAAILSNAQAARGFLRSPTADLAEVGGILEDIVRDDKRASGIIRRLRDMLRKGAVVQRERIDLNQVLQEMLGLLRRELEASPASLQLMLSATPPIVRGGRIELQQVLMNLLLNAIRAAQESPGGNQNIVLATECGATTAVVKVEDCGPGIPESSLSRIFEPFFSREAGGIGMGLSISRRIVEAHGGRIWAELRVGGGTRVAFELPLAGLEPHG